MGSLRQRFSVSEWGREGIIAAFFKHVNEVNSDLAELLKQVNEREVIIAALF